MDRIEGTAGNVIVEDGHPFRRIPMDCDLALDQDVDARGSRAPLKEAEFSWVLDVIRKASSLIGPVCRASRRRRQRLKAGCAVGLKSEGRLDDQSGGNTLQTRDLQPRGRHFQLLAADLERIFENRNPTVNS